MKKILIWTIPIILLLFGFFLAIVLEEAPKVKNLVDCYDRYGNRLIDEICEEESFVDKDLMGMVQFMFIPIPIFFFFSFFIAVVVTFSNDKSTPRGKK